MPVTVQAPFADLVQGIGDLYLETIEVLDVGWG
jgi:hypothetical protein